MKNLKLGKKAKCKVTGFTGILTARIEYLNGCVQYCIKPPVDKDGKLIDGHYFDVEQIEVLPVGEIDVNSNDAGGPQMDCPKG